MTLCMFYLLQQVASILTASMTTVRVPLSSSRSITMDATVPRDICKEQKVCIQTEQWALLSVT